jgi:hypothetical protein
MSDYYDSNRGRRQYQSPQFDRQKKNPYARDVPEKYDTDDSPRHKDQQRRDPIAQFKINYQGWAIWPSFRDPEQPAFVQSSRFKNQDGEWKDQKYFDFRGAVRLYRCLHAAISWCCEQAGQDMPSPIPDDDEQQIKVELSGDRNYLQKEVRRDAREIQKAMEPIKESYDPTAAKPSLYEPDDLRKEIFQQRMGGEQFHDRAEETGFQRGRRDDDEIPF